MQTVKNVAEAEKFFAENSSGEVICQNDGGLTKVVSNFADAETFFAGEENTEVVDEEAKPEGEATGTVAEGNQGQVPSDANQSNAGDEDLG